MVVDETGVDERERKEQFEKSGIKYRPMVEWNRLCEDLVSNSIHTWNGI